MAYVPPALRRRSDGDNEQKKGSYADNSSSHGKPAPQSSGSTLRDIQHHFWPSGDSSVTSAETGIARDPGHLHQEYSTLNGSSSSPDQLVYMLLFPNANPQWKTHSVIYAKTNLHLLPEVDDDGIVGQPSASTINDETPKTGSESNDSDNTNTKNSTTSDRLTMLKPIMVFEQMRKGIHGNFVFQGYFRINRLQILEPNSGDLVRMLDQKWTTSSKGGRLVQKQREESAWKASLRHRWAVLKLEKDETASMTLQEPTIAVTEKDKEFKSEHKSRKTVNEMLKEMRLRDNAG